MGAAEWDNTVETYRGAVQDEYPEVWYRASAEINALGGGAPHVDPETQTAMFRLAGAGDDFAFTQAMDAACSLFVQVNTHWGLALYQRQYRPL